MKSEWQEISLGEIAHIKTGKLNSNAAVDGGKYPFFTCSPEIYRIDTYAFDEEAILLAGNNADGNFNIKYFCGKFNAYQRTYIITAKNTEKCSLKYLYYALKLCLLRFKALAQGTSTKFLTLKILNSFHIALPSLQEQKYIADTLAMLDEKIELNQKINENLERQAQEIFAEHFLNVSDISDEWRTGNLLDIADYLNGLAMQKYRPKDGEIGLPVLKIKELRQGACDDSSELCSLGIKPEYIVHDGDVIFSWSGSLLVDLWCGGTCGLNQHLFKVTSKNYDKWFYYSWTLHHLNRFIAIAADKATTMGHIKREELAKAEVLIPSKSDYDKIGTVMEPIYDLIIANRLENRKLAKVRNTLLPKLMVGEIDFPPFNFQSPVNLLR